MSTDATHDHALTLPEPSMPADRLRRDRRLIAVAVFLLVAIASATTAFAWLTLSGDGNRLESTGVAAWGGPAITAGASTEVCLPNRPDEPTFMGFGLRNPGVLPVTVTAVDAGISIEAVVVVQWQDDNRSNHDFPMTLGPGQTRYILVTVRRNTAHQPVLSGGDRYAHYYTDGASVTFRLLGIGHHQWVQFQGPNGFWLGVEDASPPAMACTGH